MSGLIRHPAIVPYYCISVTPKLRAWHRELEEPRAGSVRARGPAQQGSPLSRLMMQGTLFGVLQY